MKALRANSRLVISLAICNFPLSPNGLAIEICNMNVLITYFTIDVTLRSGQNLSQTLSRVTKPNWSIVTDVIPGHNLAFDKRQLVC